MTVTYAYVGLFIRGGKSRGEMSGGKLSRYRRNTQLQIKLYFLDGSGVRLTINQGAKNNLAAIIETCEAVINTGSVM